jgi:ferric-dicitrate binding protein FerR (iron transport regulator)
MTHERLTYLLNKFAQNRLLSEERNELKQFLDGVPDNLSEDLVRPLLQEEPVDTPDYMTEAEIKAVLQSVLALDRSSSPSLHRVHFLRRWGWAAAAILLIGTTIAIFKTSHQHPDPSRNNGVVSTSSDILPGRNKAILTLSGGRQIEVDSTTSATINDGSLAIQNKNGGLVYTKNEASATNIMSTPNGGQYQLTMSDGTKVWLNSASSITYPTAFTGASRQVKITGEAYLEVAKDQAHPFIVDIAGQSTLEVLGTSFNVNSYADEGEIKTTLIEGSVRVLNKVGMSSSAPDASKASRSALLQPGQQAIIAAAISSDPRPDNAAGIIVKTDPDISQTLAWKNGLFNFNGLSVREVLYQLARWYDIKVEIRGKMPEFRFMGKMYRSANLSEVLKMLQKMEVKFRMEGKTLVVI